MPDDAFSTVKALPLDNGTPEQDRNLKTLALAVTALTDAVKENSAKVSTCNAKIDGLTEKITSVEKTFAVHQVEFTATSKQHEERREYLEKRVHDLESRQDKDEEFRSSNIMKEFDKLQGRMESEKKYNRSRRNYWIGIVGTILAGIVTTTYATQMRGCTAEAQPTQHSTASSANKDKNQSSKPPPKRPRRVRFEKK